jgi:translocator assembly and maintenance protein 41
MYNTLVNLNLEDNVTCLMKYGVISEEALIRDLFDWQYLYVSGRLHKPVKIIKRSVSGARFAAQTAEAVIAAASSSKKDLDELPDNFNFESFSKSLDLALQTNLQNALHTALLLMPEKFTLEELFICIAHISYSGDLRMVVGENKQKVLNIVRPQMHRFLELYKPYLIKNAFEKHVSCNFETGRVEQCGSQATVYNHLNQLPKHVLETIVRRSFGRAHYHDLEEYIIKLTGRADYQEVVGDAVKWIVKYASTVQAVKGVLTAGVFKTVDYSWRKLKKMVKM